MGICVRVHSFPSHPYAQVVYAEFAATPPQDGTLCRYYRLPAGVSYRVPDSMTLEDAAMVTYSTPADQLSGD